MGLKLEEREPEEVEMAEPMELLETV